LLVYLLVTAGDFHFCEENGYLNLTEGILTGSTWEEKILEVGRERRGKTKERGNCSSKGKINVLWSKISVKRVRERKKYRF
jgi:hypothetical protein